MEQNTDSTLVKRSVFMTILEKLFGLNMNLENLMLDMQLDAFKHFDYDCLPTGALPFASMHVDGLCYCIIPKANDDTLEQSPVYRISPMDFSDGLIMWTAKNFYEFISITIILKDAWELPILVHEYSNDKQGFLDHLDGVKSEFNVKTFKEKRAIKKELKLLKSNFDTITIPDLYFHIMSSYLDINNHADVRFSDEEIREITLGHYAYGD
jgi:hypothetical protein